MALELDELNALKKRVLSEAPRNYPTHDELIKSLQSMGYYGNIGGVCAGIAELANLFCVMGRQDEYKLRMRLIQSLLRGFTLDEQGRLQRPNPLNKGADYANLKVQFAKIEAKLRKQGKEGFNQLTTEEQMIYEVVHFLQNIQLHFDPATYPELFNEGMNQNQVEMVSKLTAFKELEDPTGNFKGIEKICADPTVKTKAELDDYFTDLKKDVETLEPEVQKQLSFTIDSLKHRIMISYQGNDQWLFVDANQLGASEIPIATTDVGKKIRNAMQFDFPDEDRFPLNINIYAASDRAQEVRNKLSSDPTHKNSYSKANKITQAQAKNIVGLVHGKHMDLTKIKKVIDALTKGNKYSTGNQFVTEMEALLANGNINKGEYIKFVSGAMEFDGYKKLIEAIIHNNPLSLIVEQNIRKTLNNVLDKKSQLSFTKELLSKNIFTSEQFVDALHQELKCRHIKISDMYKGSCDSYSKAQKTQVLSLGAEHGVHIINNGNIILQEGEFALDAAYGWKEAAFNAARYGQVAFIKEMKNIIDTKMTDSEKINLARIALSKGKTDVFKVLEQENLVPNKPLNDLDNLKLAKAAAESGCFEIIKKFIDDKKIDLTLPPPSKDDWKELAEAAIKGGRFQELFDVAIRAEEVDIGSTTAKEARAFANDFKNFLTANKFGKDLVQYAVSLNIRGAIRSLVENDVIDSSVLSKTLETSAAEALNEYKNIYNATYGNQPHAKKPTQEQQKKLRDYPQIMEEIALSASSKGLEDIVKQCYEKSLAMERLARTYPTIPPVRTNEMALNAMRILIDNEKECTDLSMEIAKYAVTRGKHEVVRELLKIFADAQLKNGGALKANGQSAWDELTAQANVFVKNAYAQKNTHLIGVLVRNNLLALDKRTLKDYEYTTDSILASAKEDWNISDMMQWQKHLEERLAKVALDKSKIGERLDLKKQQLKKENGEIKRQDTVDKLTLEIERLEKQLVAKTTVEKHLTTLTIMCKTTMDEIVAAASSAGTKLLSNVELKTRALTPTEMKLLDKQLRTLEDVFSPATQKMIPIDLIKAKDELTKLLNAGSQVAEEFLKNPVAMSNSGKDTLRKYAALLDRVSSTAMELGLREVIIESYKKVITLNESYKAQNHGNPLFDMEIIAYPTVDALLEGVSKGDPVDGIMELVDLPGSSLDLLEYIANETTKKDLDQLNSAHAEKYKEIITKTAERIFSSLKNDVEKIGSIKTSESPTIEEATRQFDTSLALLKGIEDRGGQLPESLKKDLQASITKKEKALRDIFDNQLFDVLKSEVKKIDFSQIKNSPTLEIATDQYNNGLAQLENFGNQLGDSMNKVNNWIGMVGLKEEISKKKNELHSNFQQKFMGVIREKIQPGLITKSKTMNEAKTRYDDGLKLLNDFRSLGKNLPWEKQKDLYKVIDTGKDTLEAKFKEKEAFVKNIKEASEEYVKWFDSQSKLSRITHTAKGRANAQSILDLINGNKPLLDILRGTEIALANSGNNNHSYSRFLHDKLQSNGPKTVGKGDINDSKFEENYRVDLQNNLSQIITDERVRQEGHQVEDDNVFRPQSPSVQAYKR